MVHWFTLVFVPQCWEALFFIVYAHFLPPTFLVVDRRRAGFVKNVKKKTFFGTPFYFIFVLSTIEYHFLFIFSVTQTSVTSINCGSWAPLLHYFLVCMWLCMRGDDVVEVAEQHRRGKTKYIILRPHNVAIISKAFACSCIHLRFSTDLLTTDDIANFGYSFGNGHCTAEAEDSWLFLGGDVYDWRVHDSVAVLVFIQICLCLSPWIQQFGTCEMCVDFWYFYEWMWF